MILHNGKESFLTYASLYQSRSSRYNHTENVRILSSIYPSNVSHLKNNLFTCNCFNFSQKILTCSSESQKYVCRQAGCEPSGLRSGPILRYTTPSTVYEARPLGVASLAFMLAMAIPALYRLMLVWKNFALPSVAVSKFFNISGGSGTISMATLPELQHMPKRGFLAELFVRRSFDHIKDLQLGQGEFMKPISCFGGKSNEEMVSMLHCCADGHALVTRRRSLLF